MIIVLRLLAFIAGSYLVIFTFLAATRTFVVPRSEIVFLSRFIFSASRLVFNKIASFLPDYESKDRLMGLYAPLTLLFMPPTWLFLTTIGFTGIFWATGIEPWRDAFLLSGSSILTLGFSTADTTLQTVIAFVEATIGLILVAMLISYLPTMYAAFSKRETAVSLMEVRAGSPPTAPELVWRLHSFGQITDMTSFWRDWEAWFTELDETHTSLPALVFFRSPQSHMSWVTSAEAVLDGAAIYLGATTMPNRGFPALVIRAGNQALRHIADYFNVAYNPDPHFPADPISVSREEFDEAYDRLLWQGVPLIEDKDLAWTHYAGWRVNYDSCLNGLKTLAFAPPTPWISPFTFVPNEPGSGQSGGERIRASEAMNASSK